MPGMSRCATIGIICMPVPWAVPLVPVWVRMSQIQYHRVDIPTQATTAVPEVPSIWTSQIQKRVWSSYVHILADIFFIPLTQKGFMRLLTPSQTASAPNRVGVVSTGLEVPVPAPTEGAN